MNKKQIKPSYYDEFTCIADRCTITCCKEWKIEVDDKTLTSWEVLQLEDEDKTKVTSLVDTKDGVSLMKLDHKKRCPFLAENDLCKLVTQFGEDVLSKTCTTFPREVHEYSNRVEHTLVACCPSVVDLLHASEKLELQAEGDQVNEDLMYQLRHHMISFIQEKNYSIGKTMMMIFYLLLDLEEKGLSEQALQAFDSPKVLQELSDAIDGMAFSDFNTMDENNELFLDLAENYRKQQIYTEFLEEIGVFAEEISEGYDEEVMEEWMQSFEEQIAAFEPMFRKYLAAEFFTNLLSSEAVLEDVLMKFEWITLEYAIIRHTLFLHFMYQEQEEISYEQVRDAIVIISRMTGYEDDDIIEYLEQSFEELLWDWGYLALLVGNR